MERRRSIQTALVVLGLAACLAAPAWAADETKPDMAVKVSLMREVVVSDPQGKPRVELEPVSTTKPGDTLVYKILYTNTGDAPAHNARVVDPIPTGTLLIPASCAPAGSELTASLDGGKTFERFPARRTVSLPDGGTELRDVDPALYTHLAWTSGEPLAPGATRQAQFKVKVR